MKVILVIRFPSGWLLMKPRRHSEWAGSSLRSTLRHSSSLWLHWPVMVTKPNNDTTTTTTLMVREHHASCQFCFWKAGFPKSPIRAPRVWGRTELNPPSTLQTELSLYDESRLVLLGPLQALVRLKLLGQLLQQQHELLLLQRGAVGPRQRQVGGHHPSVWAGGEAERTLLLWT